MTVSGLSGDITYYFAMKTSDEVPNTSALSNVASGQTADNVAPAAVSNLATSSPTTSAVTLSWTAPGDSGSTGTATSYDIRYRTGGAVTDGNWASATQVTGEPTPAVAGTCAEHDRHGPVAQHDLLLRDQDGGRGAERLGHLQQPQRQPRRPRRSARSAPARHTPPSRRRSTAAADWDTIEIDPGTYTQASGWASISKNHLTIRGVGSSRPILDANGSCLSGKGIFNISGTDTTVQNLEFKNSRNVTDLNAAGIRLEAANLTVQNCYFHDNDNGILVERRQRQQRAGRDQRVQPQRLRHRRQPQHLLQRVDSFTLRYCYVHNAYAGHEVKTRAAVNYILYNRIGNEGGTGS